MASNRPHTWKDEQQYQQQVTVIPEDAKTTLLALLDELGEKSYLEWCEAFIEPQDDWATIQGNAATTLEEIQASHERL